MKAKMLLADDDEEVLAALSAALASEDYDVVVAKNDREAIEHFEEDRFDIALLDLNMPVKGGWEAFERLTMIHPLLQVDSFGCRQYRQSDFAAMRFALHLFHDRQRPAACTDHTLPALPGYLLLYREQCMPKLVTELFGRFLALADATAVDQP